MVPLSLWGSFKGPRTHGVPGVVGLKVEGLQGSGNVVKIGFVHRVWGLNVSGNGVSGLGLRDSSGSRNGV